MFRIAVRIATYLVSAHIIRIFQSAVLRVRTAGREQERDRQTGRERQRTDYKCHVLTRTAAALLVSGSIRMSTSGSVCRVFRDHRARAR